MLGSLHQVAAQTCTIKGSVSDTLNIVPLPSASVVLFRASDSVIQAFSRTSYDGTFLLHVPAEGKYILRITFPSFADYEDMVNVKTTTDLGMIPMVSKEHLLKEFVITREFAAIKIKGDTTEYVADSFKVKENANVEELLKRLPGIQVDKNGQITAQGETVQKILVDGEEFFSDDPKVVTQGLQANVVDKVQVYDKKSDQAEFTGIDDGQKTKTINLELKEDKKKGYFGKLDAGGGTDGYFQNQAMINSFKAKQQFSAFGIVSNTDKVGLGWQDNDKFGSGSGVTEISDDGGVMTTYSSGPDEDMNGWNGSYSGQGLPKTWTGGVHYADKWDEDKDHVSANYRYAMQDVEIDGNSTTQYILGKDSSSISNQVKNQFSKGERHGVDALYDWKIDSSTSIRLTTNAGYKSTQTLSKYHTTTSFLVDDVSDTVNTNDRTYSSTAYGSFINTDLLFRKKFAKKGRTLSVDVKENYKDSRSTGQLTSNTFSNILSTDSLINQRKVNNTNTLAFAAKATYTEPLSKVAFLELNYGVTVNNSTSENLSYDAPVNTSNFDSLDRYYSANYKYNILSNSGGLNFKFVYKDYNFNFGTDVANNSYLQTDLLNNDTTHRYNYLNLFPHATFTYKLSKQTNLKLQYQGSSQQPSINQIQPLRQNTDPLNITVGNPNLKQEFINKFSLNFHDYKVLTNRYIYVGTSFSTIQDAISTSQTTTPYGVNTTQYINVNGNYNGNAYGGIGYKLPKTDINVGIWGNAAVNHVNSIINQQNASSNNNSFSITPRINYYKADKYDFGFAPSITYNDNTSNISLFSTNYWLFDGNFEGSMQLPKKFDAGTDIDVMIRQKTVAFPTNNNVVKWNAYIGKKFAKKDQFEIRATVNDILNQNIGYSRTAQGAIITQNSYNTIRRYGMLSLIWNFTHTPGGAPAPPGGGMMIH
jgi:hypothetical protein